MTVNSISVIWTVHKYTLSLSCFQCTLCYDLSIWHWGWPATIMQLLCNSWNITKKTSLWGMAFEFQQPICAKARKDWLLLALKSAFPLWSTKHFLQEMQILATLLILHHATSSLLKPCTEILPKNCTYETFSSSSSSFSWNKTTEANERS